jgi:hypothetical protein
MVISIHCCKAAKTTGATVDRIVLCTLFCINHISSAIAQAARYWLLTAETLIQSRVTSSDIRDGRSGTEAGCSPSSSVPPFHRYFTLIYRSPIGCAILLIKLHIIISSVVGYGLIISGPPYGWFLSKGSFSYKNGSHKSCGY